MPKKGNSSKRSSSSHASAGASSSKSASNQGNLTCVCFCFFHAVFTKFYFITGKQSGRGRAEPLIGSDEDSQHDTASIVSSVSENRSVLDEGEFS